MNRKRVGKKKQMENQNKIFPTYGQLNFQQKWMNKNRKWITGGYSCQFPVALLSEISIPNSETLRVSKYNQQIRCKSATRDATAYGKQQGPAGAQTAIDRR